MTKKRILAWMLIAVLFIGVLAGCGDGENTVEPETGEQTGQENPAETEYVYQAEYLNVNLDASYQLSYMENYCVSGNYVFFTGDCVTGKEVYTDEITGETVIDEETGEPMEVDVYETGIFRLDLDTQEVIRLEGYHTAEVPEGLLGGSSIMNVSVGSDGTLWILERMYTYSYDLPEDFDAENDQPWNYYTPGENSITLRHLDTEGQDLGTVDLSALGDAYPQEMRLDEAGNIYINTGDMIYLLDPEGAVLAELNNDNWMNLCQLSGTGVGVIGYDQEAGGRVFRLIDPEQKDFGEKVELESNASRLYAGFGDYEYLYDDYSDAVYGYNQETGESEKLFSWVDCDVSSDYLDYENPFFALPDGRIIAMTRDYSQEPTKYELICLKQVDASTLPQKQTLTLGCMYTSQNVRNAVIKFNKTHNDVRIEIKDYSEYNTDDDYTAGQTRLNTEILSGVVPDILDTSSLPVDQYAAKGLLVDLWPLIDSDAELTRDDLMTHLFEVMSINGKLYRVTDSFSIQTAVGNADVIGDRTSWTLDELLEAKASLGENATIFGDYDTKTGILSSCVSRSVENFIDWETLTCSFDSEEFIELLNFANSFPAEFDWENYDYEDAESTYSRFTNGRQLLLDAYINEFAFMQMLGEMVGGNPCYVGYPSANGNGSTFSLGTSLSITTGCSNPELAWSFVRTLLTEDYQNDGYTWNFPSNRHVFEALVEETMTPEYETDPETGEQVEVSHSSWGWDDLTVEIMAMTQEEYDTFMRLYESCNTVYSSNDTVWSIIQEEVEPFFAGQKTAEETAKLVQDRVGLYVMEQG